ncbi:MAG: hypothetical protein H9W81_13980 [Enterococcus sp.]|nr:hypothetical protein [Enterococcus sp.]
MKKIAVIVIAVLLLAGVAFAVLHQIKSKDLDNLVEDTKNADIDYTPPAEYAEATERLNVEKANYPNFFDGGGMQELDFEVRTELGAEHQNRIEKLGMERSADADRLWDKYWYVAGAKDRINEYLVYRDSIIEKDLQAGISYDKERMELFDQAVKFCEADTSITEYVATQQGTENYLRQLGFVLYNAEENLCPKL